MAGYQPGSTVEYYSASLNNWIPARVLGTGQSLGTLELDCKSDVDISRVRLPSAISFGVNPNATQVLGQQRPSQAARLGPLALRAGDPCFYKSNTHGWITAKALGFDAHGNTYDLDVKTQVGMDKIYCIQEDSLVEYHSASKNEWISAQVLQRGQIADTFDLDVKAGVNISKLRPPGGDNVGLAASTSSRPTVSFAQPQPKLEQLRDAVDAEDPIALRKRLESKSALNFVGEELDRAQHALWMIEARPGAVRDLKKAAAGNNVQALQMALEAAAVVLVDDDELEAATHRLRDLKAKTWRYVITDLHMDLRKEPFVNGKRVPKHLNPGEEFLVEREQKGAEGITYLKLADGRGWAFDWKPGVGKMCERRYAAEEEQWANQGRHPMGKTVADLRNQQKSCLRKSRPAGLDAIPEAAGDTPGMYAIVEETGVTPGLELCAERDLVTRLQAGALVEVLEVVVRDDQKRIRGYIKSPVVGWISLLDTTSGLRWARKQAY